MNAPAKVSTLDLTVTELAAGIASTTIDPTAIVEDALARIDRPGVPTEGPGPYVDAATARATAVDGWRQESQARKAARGPLHGVPIGVKDVFHAAGMPTVANSKTMDPAARYPDSGGRRGPPARPAPSSSARPRRFEFAGGGINAETVNPWNPGHTPGGIEFRLRRGGRRPYGTGRDWHADRRIQFSGRQPIAASPASSRPTADCRGRGFSPSPGRSTIPASSPAALPTSASSTARSPKRPPAKEQSERAWRIWAAAAVSFWSEASRATVCGGGSPRQGVFVEAGATLTEPPLPDNFKKPAGRCTA